MDLQRAHRLGVRPTLVELRAKFGRLRIVAIVAGCSIFFLTDGVLTAVTYSAGVFDYNAFKLWVTIKVQLCTLSLLVVISCPRCVKTSLILDRSYVGVANSVFPVHDNISAWNGIVRRISVAA